MTKPKPLSSRTTTARPTTRPRKHQRIAGRVTLRQAAMMLHDEGLTRTERGVWDTLRRACDAGLFPSLKIEKNLYVWRYVYPADVQRYWLSRSRS